MRTAKIPSIYFSSAPCGKLKTLYSRRDTRRRKVLRNLPELCGSKGMREPASESLNESESERRKRKKEGGREGKGKGKGKREEGLGGTREA